MMIDLEELDTMPADVLRGIQAVISSELAFRRQQSAFDSRCADHLRSVAGSLSEEKKHRENLEAAIERWNNPQASEGIF